MPLCAGRRASGPWHKFVDAAVWPSFGDLLHDAAYVGERFDAVQFASLDDGVDGLVTPLRACGPAGGSVAKGMKKISYRGYRFPPEIMQQAIWLYLRFTLSLRDVEDLLAERGIMVSYETVRRWVNHFGPMIAANLRKRRPKPHTTWHLDEVYLKIAGRMVYLWRAVDAEGEVLDVLVQSRRNKRAALKLMRKLLKKYGFVPDKLVTDDLRSYAAAASDLGIAKRHERGRWRNNRAENSHQPTRRREYKMQGFKSVRVQPKDFSPLTQPPTTLSTSNAISFRQERTELPRIGDADVARSRRCGVNLTSQEICYVLYLPM